MIIAAARLNATHPIAASASSAVRRRRVPTPDGWIEPPGEIRDIYIPLGKSPSRNRFVRDGLLVIISRQNSPGSITGYLVWLNMWTICSVLLLPSLLVGVEARVPPRGYASKIDV